MAQRRKIVVSLALLTIILTVMVPEVGAISRRKCRVICADYINNCIALTGKPKRCKHKGIHLCRHHRKICISTTSSTTVTSTSTTTIIDPHETADLVIQTIWEEKRSSSSNLFYGVVGNIGQQSYCQVVVIPPCPESWRQAVEATTLYDASRQQLSDHCLRPGDIGLFDVDVDCTDPQSTASKVKIVAVESKVEVPDSDLVVVEIGGSYPSHWPFTITLKNQGSKTAKDINGDVIFKNAQGQFVGIGRLDSGYPDDFPMGDDRCMFVGDELAIYDCIQPSKTKLFGVLVYNSLDPESMIFSTILTQWYEGDLVRFPPAAPGTTMTLQSISKGHPDAQFIRDRTVFYANYGGGDGGRGINVAVLDHHTGVILHLKSFDTWAESDADDRLVAFIQSLPDGVIVLTAVADEGARQLSVSARDSLSQLLGSQLIHQLHYWSTWAMITTKGSPQSIAEKIADPLDKYGTKRVRVDVEATLTLQ